MFLKRVPIFAYVRRQISGLRTWLVVQIDKPKTAVHVYDGSALSLNCEPHDAVNLWPNAADLSIRQVSKLKSISVTLNQNAFPRRRHRTLRFLSTLARP